MAINYAKIFNRRATPQSQPMPGSSQVRNSGGGYSWQVDDWTRFDRFLILGAEGGTYYITERDLVKQNHDALVRCIKSDGMRAVNRIVETTQAGAKASACTFNFYPVGRAVQAAVCKTAEAGAIPARDSSLRSSSFGSASHFSEHKC